MSTMAGDGDGEAGGGERRDRKSTRLNSSHMSISYAVFCLKKKTQLKASACRIFDSYDIGTANAISMHIADHPHPPKGHITASEASHTREPANVARPLNRFH